MKDLQAQISQDKTDSSEKTQAKTKNLQGKAETKGDLVEVSKLEADDKKLLSSLTSECKQKTAEFESRQNLRRLEISSIEKAIEILSSSAVKGNAEKYPT